MSATSDRLRAYYATQLEAGVLIGSRENHHAGMRFLLGARNGCGLSLSLVSFDHAYLGYHGGNRTPYVLGALPGDYTLETILDNQARGNPLTDTALVDRLVDAGRWGNGQSRDIYVAWKKEQQS